MPLSQQKSFQTIIAAADEYCEALLDLDDVEAQQDVYRAFVFATLTQLESNRTTVVRLFGNLLETSQINLLRSASARMQFWGDVLDELKPS